MLFRRIAIVCLIFLSSNFWVRGATLFAAGSRRKEKPVEHFKLFAQELPPPWLDELQRKHPQQHHLNYEQLSAVKATAGPTLILAGPGTGKTRTCTYLTANLIEQGVSPTHILG